MGSSIILASLMYVLTGSTSVGKTSIIHELEKQGEPVIHEAATDWIQSRLDAGVKEFWKEEDFIYNIFKLQVQREAPFLSKQGRVFIDRGLFDGYAFILPHALAGTNTHFAINAELGGIDLNQRYAAIFFILPHTDGSLSVMQNGIRQETAQQARELQAALFSVYCQHKNFFVVPGNLTPQERATFILERVHQLEASNP
jgi:predicted ATPase